MIAVAAAISDSVMGRSADADRWVGWIERWRSHDGAQHSDPGTKGWAAVTRAFVCRHGVEQMRVDADEAAQVLPAQHVMIPLTGLLQGVARVLSGDLESGDAFLEDSVAAGEDFSGPHHPIAVAERSLLAIKRADWDQAALLAHEARTLLRDSGLDQSTMAAPLVCAVQARVLLHRGDAEAAREQALCAQRLRPWLSYAIPYVAAQARMELTRVYLALGDAAGARTLMREVDEILEHRPRLGTIVDEAQGLRSQLANERHNGSRGASTLTAAELRLLPMIATHLHYREIAQELYLSHNTVRTQSSSIYRKLGVSSRAEAVARAREIGLIE
jgi:LuxR family maltose regulon positive regulatory protein